MEREMSNVALGLVLGVGMHNIPAGVAIGLALDNFEEDNKPKKKRKFKKKKV